MVGEKLRNSKARRGSVSRQGERLDEMSIDPEEERRRLSEWYAAMNDGELDSVAADAYQLSEKAREALHLEMEKRSLALPDNFGAPPPVVEPEPEPEPQPIMRSEKTLKKLVTIRRFRDLPEAILAKGALDSAGIECFLADDEMVRMDWFISNVLEGIKLRVKPEDADVATEILEQPIPEQFDAGEEEDYKQPRCPKCDSVKVTFRGLNKPAAYASAWLNFPIPFRSKVWRCEACGSKWVEEPEPKVEPQPE
jgi:hypothetical protein